jgi:hypothetical protein
MGDRGEKIGRWPSSSDDVRIGWEF